MLRLICIVLIVALIAGCTVNEASHVNGKNVNEQSEMMNTIEQYKLDNSQKLEQIRRESLLYRQALEKAFSDLEILKHKQELFQTHPNIQNAINETVIYRQDAIAAGLQQEQNLKSQLEANITDSLLTMEYISNSIELQDKKAKLEKEIEEIKNYLRYLEDRETGINTRKTDDNGEKYPAKKPQINDKIQNGIAQ